MWQDTLKLITITQTQDDYGVWRQTEASTEVYCGVNSVTRTEFFEAGRAGLNPAYVFTIFGDDYNGAEIIEYGGKRYGVYRTFRDGDDLELYAERKGGTNAAPTVTTTTTTTTVTTTTAT